jgi:hypothetical protein
MFKLPLFSIFCLSAALLVPGLAQGAAPEDPAASLTITSFTFHGWPGSYRMSNAKAQVIVVPAIGRVMQFSLAGDEDGPFWADRKLDGKAPDPKSSEWMNFGGDKTWPQPQSEWKQTIGRPWPPPSGFDAAAVQARISGDEIVLTSPVDPDFGIEIVRSIRLDSKSPVMTIATAYHKVSGNPVKVGAWVITQLREPRRLFALLPEKSIFEGGHKRIAGPTPKDFQVAGRLLSLARNPGAASLIGLDGGSLLWMDGDYALSIDSARVPGDYAGDGCSAYIYTNQDPAPYIELETSGPLTVLREGDRIEHTVTYRLTRRTEKDPRQEAEKAWGLKAAGR